MVELQPVDAVEVTLVVDNFVDILLAGAEGVRRLPLAYDHFDQDQLVARTGRRLPLLIHPEAWRERKVTFPTGAELRLPPPSRADLEAEGLEVVEERGPTLLLDGHLMISGQVPRVTEFEVGFPIHKARDGDGWEPDPLILDDQNVIVDVAGKGLVVVSGCSHAGAVNVLRNARRLTGRDRVAGFVGGFHLTGAVFEPIIEPTVAAFAEFGVGRFVPGHCTGWKATHRLAAAFPGAFIQPSVGTVLRF